MSRIYEKGSSMSKKIPSTITYKNRVGFAKMVVCGLQEERVDIRNWNKETAAFLIIL